MRFEVNSTRGMSTSQLRSSVKVYLRVKLTSVFRMGAVIHARRPPSRLFLSTAMLPPVCGGDHFTSANARSRPNCSSAPVLPQTYVGHEQSLSERPGQENFLRQKSPVDRPDIEELTREIKGRGEIRNGIGSRRQKKWQWKQNLGIIRGLYGGISYLYHSHDEERFHHPSHTPKLDQNNQQARKE